MSLMMRAFDAGVLIFLAYEAGQHLCGTGGNENDQDMTDKFIAANRHPIFEKEDKEEISLLDGIAENQIIDKAITIEQPNKEPKE